MERMKKRTDFYDFIDKIQRQDRYIGCIEEENKKLKEDNRFLTRISKEYMEKENIIEVTEFTELYKDDLEEENKKLKKYYDRDKEELMESCYSLAKENDELREGNKKLNIKVASLEGEIKGLNYTIEKLKEENQTLELWLDNKEKVNKSLREENKKLKEDVDYRHHRCMVAERGGEDED